MKSALKILLIEDNPDHTELIISSIKKDLLHARITSASTAQESLRFLKQKHFDVILMDYYLKDALGPHLLSELTQRYPHTPVLIISGEGDERTATKSIKAGAEDYIVKTRESLEALPKIILKALEKRKLKKQDRKKPKKKGDDLLVSSFFEEIEKMAHTLKSAYQGLNKKNSPKSSPPKTLKKLSGLEKKMCGLKKMVQRLLGSSE